jgi:hypothetical protein
VWAALALAAYLLALLVVGALSFRTCPEEAAALHEVCGLSPHREQRGGLCCNVQLLTLTLPAAARAPAGHHPRQAGAGSAGLRL